MSQSPTSDAASTPDPAASHNPNPNPNRNPDQNPDPNPDPNPNPNATPNTNLNPNPNRNPTLDANPDNPNTAPVPASAFAPAPAPTSASAPFPAPASASSSLPQTQSSAFATRSRFANRNLNTLTSVSATKGLGVRSSALVLRNDRRVPAKGIGIVAAPTPLNTSTSRTLSASPAIATQTAPMASNSPNLGQQQRAEAMPLKHSPQYSAPSGRLAWSKDSLDIRTRLKQSQPVRVQNVPLQRDPNHDRAHQTRPPIHNFPQQSQPAVAPPLNGQSERTTPKRAEKKGKPKRIVIGEAAANQRWGDFDSDDDEDEDEEEDNEEVEKATATIIPSQGQEPQPRSGHLPPTQHNTPVPDSIGRDAPSRADAFVQSAVAGQDVRFSTSHSHSRGPRVDPYGQNNESTHGHRAPEMRSVGQNWERASSLQSGTYEDFGMRSYEVNPRGQSRERPSFEDSRRASFEDSRRPSFEDKTNWRSRTHGNNFNDRSEDARRHLGPVHDEDEELRALARSREEREMLEKKKQHVNEPEFNHRREQDVHTHFVPTRETSARLEDSSLSYSRSRPRDDKFVESSRSSDVRGQVHATSESNDLLKDSITPRRILTNEARIMAQQTAKEEEQDQHLVTPSSKIHADQSKRTQPLNRPTAEQIHPMCQPLEGIQSPPKEIHSKHQSMDDNQTPQIQVPAGAKSLSMQIEDTLTSPDTISPSILITTSHHSADPNISPERMPNASADPIVLEQVVEAGEQISTEYDQEMHSDNHKDAVSAELDSESTAFEPMSKDLQPHDRMEGSLRTKQLFDYKSGRMVDAGATTNKGTEGKWKRGATWAGPMLESTDGSEKDRERRSKSDGKRESKKHERKRNKEADLKLQTKLKEEKDEESRVRQEARMKERSERAPRTQGQLFKYDDDGLIVRVWGKGEQEAEEKKNADRQNREKKRRETVGDQRKNTKSAKESERTRTADYVDTQISSVIALDAKQDPDLPVVEEPRVVHVSRKRDKEELRRSEHQQPRPSNKGSERETDHGGVYISNEKIAPNKQARNSDPKVQASASGEVTVRTPVVAPEVTVSTAPLKPAWQGRSTLEVLGVKPVQQSTPTGDDEIKSAKPPAEITETVLVNVSQQPPQTQPPDETAEIVHVSRKRNERRNSKAPRRLYKPKQQDASVEVVELPLSITPTDHSTHRAAIDTTLSANSAPSLTPHGDVLIHDKGTSDVTPRTEAGNTEEDTMATATVESVAKIVTDDADTLAHSNVHAQPVLQVHHTSPTLNNAIPAHLLTPLGVGVTPVHPLVTLSQDFKNDRWKAANRVPAVGVGSWQAAAGGSGTWPPRVVFQPAPLNSTETFSNSMRPAGGDKAGLSMHGTMIGLPPFGALVWQLQPGPHPHAYAAAPWMVHSYPGNAPGIVNSQSEESQLSSQSFVGPRPMLRTNSAPVLTPSTMTSSIDSHVVVVPGPRSTAILPTGSVMNTWPVLAQPRSQIAEHNKPIPCPPETVIIPAKPTRIGQDHAETDGLIDDIRSHVNSHEPLANTREDMSSHAESRPKQHGQKQTHRSTQSKSKEAAVATSKRNREPRKNQNGWASEARILDELPRTESDPQPQLQPEPQPEVSKTQGNREDTHHNTTKLGSRTSIGRTTQRYVAKKTSAVVPEQSNSVSVDDDSKVRGGDEKLADEKPKSSNTVRVWDGPSVPTPTATKAHAIVSKGPRNAGGDNRPRKQIYKPKPQQTQAQPQGEPAPAQIQLQGKPAKPSVKRYVAKTNPTPNPSPNPHPIPTQGSTDA